MSYSQSSTSVSLLGRIQQSSSDEQAWKEFVDRYGSRIFLWCENRGLQPDDAEDVTQQVLIRMCKYIRKFEYDPGQSFTAYLRRATENAISDFLRQRYQSVVAQGGSEVISWMESVEAREELAARLKEVFDIELLEHAMSRVRNRVNDGRWQAWYLTTIVQRDNKDVAMQLEMSIATLYAAKNQVGKMVRDEVQRLEGRDVAQP